MSWQNLDEKPRGSFVTNVHPCNVGHPDGVVLGEDGLGNLSVQVGSGSHVYGPAENWAPVVAKPDWLARMESIAARCLCPDDCNCRRTYRPNYCGCTCSWEVS